MPKVEDHYVGAEIMLPRGDEMARGHVVAQSHDASGNVMGRAHVYTIMNTRMHQVEFAEGKVTELTANIISESMYAQYDADGNEYLLLDMLVDYYKDNKGIFLTDHQTSIWGRPVTHNTTAGCQICCQWKDGSTS